MRSSPPATRASLPVRLATVGVLLFLHLPMLVIALFAFTTDDTLFRFPPPGLTTQWFAVAWHQPDIWDALSLSVRVAALTTAVALVLGDQSAQHPVQSLDDRDRPRHLLR